MEAPIQVREEKMCNTNNCCYVYATIARHAACGSGIGQLGSPIPCRRVISSTFPLPIYHDIFLKDGQIAHKFHDSIAWWRYSNNNYHLYYYFNQFVSQYVCKKD